MNPSTSLYYISLFLGWEIDDQHKNRYMNNKDHIVGQLTAWALAQVALIGGKSSIYNLSVVSEAPLGNISEPPVGGTNHSYARTYICILPSGRVTRAPPFHFLTILHFDIYSTFQIWAQYNCHARFPFHLLPISCCMLPISHPTPRIALFVRPSVTEKDRIVLANAYTMQTSSPMYDAWVTRPERPKGAKDEVKQARRAAS